MEMARVIVDVPSKDTDRPFDYLIPEELRPWVEVGSRVGRAVRAPYAPGIRGLSASPARDGFGQNEADSGSPRCDAAAFA